MARWLLFFSLSFFVICPIWAQEERMHIARDMFWIADAHDALGRDDVADLREALDHGGDRVGARTLRAFFKDAKTAQIATLLLDRGLSADDYDPNDEDATLLHIADNAEVAKLLLDRGAKINVRNSFLETPLFFVWDEPLIRTFLAAGADPNLKDKHGRTPLFYASMYRRFETIKLLLAAGADQDIEDNFRMTAAKLLDHEPDIGALLGGKEEIERLRLELVKSRIERSFGYPIDSKISMEELLQNREITGSFDRAR